MAGVEDATITRHETGAWPKIEPHTRGADLKRKVCASPGSGTPPAGSLDVSKLALVRVRDKCDPEGRHIDYELRFKSGKPLGRDDPQFYVYEIQSNQNLAEGGPFPGTTYRFPNAFSDWLFPDPFRGKSVKSSVQQFGISLQQPNPSGVPGGKLVMIRWNQYLNLNFDTGQNTIQLSTTGIQVNGEACQE